MVNHIPGVEIIFKYLHAKRENALAARLISCCHPQFACNIKFSSVCNGVTHI